MVIVFGILISIVAFLLLCVIFWAIGEIWEATDKIKIKR